MTGKQFAVLRKKLGYSAKSLASRFDCTDRTIRNFQTKKKVDGIVELAMRSLELEQKEKEKAC